MLTAAEVRYAPMLLADKLEVLRAPVLIFSFRDAARELLGPFPGNGWLRQQFAGARLFMMPGPYESRATGTPTLASRQDVLV